MQQRLIRQDAQSKKYGLKQQPSHSKQLQLLRFYQRALVKAKLELDTECEKLTGKEW